MYELEFEEEAWKEWVKLGSTVKEQFKKKLAKVLISPHVSANKLRDLSKCYKIKLRTSGYRLVYEVNDTIVTVTVIAIGKRERNGAYEIAAARLQNRD